MRITRIKLMASAFFFKCRLIKRFKVRFLLGYRVRWLLWELLFFFMEVQKDANLVLSSWFFSEKFARMKKKV